MRELFTCALDGQPFHCIDDQVILLDIQELSEDADVRTAELSSGRTRFLNRLRHSLTLQIQFEIHEYDPPRRKHLCQEINRWAMSGRILTISDRPGQQLRVRCIKPLLISSSLRWTQSLVLTFAAYDRPWWEDETPTVLSFSAAKASHSGTLSLPGTAEKALAEAEIVPSASGSGNVTVSVGDTSITLEGVALTAGQTVRIGYTEDGILEIKNGSRSILGSRTGESSDDLLAVPGKANAVSITAPVTVTAKVSARGCWL